MPCRTYDYEHPEEYAKLQKKQDETRLEEQKLLIDTFARHLCFMCTQAEKIFGKNIWDRFKQIPKNEEHNNAAAEIEKWWTQHQKDDAAEAARKALIAKKEESRLRVEAQVEKALSKLTPQEKKLLGF